MADELWTKLEKDLEDNVYLDLGQASDVVEFLRDNDIVLEETLKEVYDYD